MRATGVDAAAKATAPAAAPPHPALKMTEDVLRVAMTSPDPAVVLRLGSAESPVKGYRKIAMTLHPDRLGGLSPDQQARSEKAFKLAKAAWEACPSSPDYTLGTAEYYQRERASLAEAKQKAPAPPPPNIDPATFDENLKAYQRAQAKAAEEAAKAAAEGAKQARENALANAKMILGGLHTGLKGGVEQLERELATFASGPLLKELQDHNERVLKTPVDLKGFDPKRPEARQKLETFRTESVAYLRGIYDQLGPLKLKVEALKKSAQRHSESLGRLRASYVDAKRQLQILERNEAPASEIKKWRERLLAHDQRIDAASSTIKAIAKEQAEAERQMAKLSGAVPFLLRQATEGRKVEYAQSQLDGTYMLEKKAFRGHAAEWAARIEQISSALAKATQSLEEELLTVPLRIRGQSFGTNLRFALAVDVRKHVESARYLRSRISEDVWAALPVDTRTKLENLLADVAQLEQAKEALPTREHGTLNYATKVVGLHSTRVQGAWNQLVEEGLQAEAYKREAIWARRDPTKFYGME